jgi:hypothetical protein
MNPDLLSWKAVDAPDAAFPDGNISAHAVAALTRIKTQVVNRGGKFFLGVGPPFHRHFKGKPYESSRMTRETVSNSTSSFIHSGGCGSFAKLNILATPWRQVS